MNRFTTLLSALVLSASAAAAENYTVKQTSDGFLNMRSGPGTNFDVINRVYPNMVVDVLENKGRWFRVRVPGAKKSGWVSSNFLTGPQVFSGDTVVVQQTNDGFLNMRSGPGTNFDILRRMYPGDRLRVLERQGNWLRVQTANGSKGWASHRYVK